MQSTDKSISKKKLRFNIIDLLILIVILGAIATVVVRLDITDKIVQSTAEDSAKVTLLITSVDPTAVAAVAEGDEIVWEQENCYFGKIVSKEVSNAVVYNTVEDGSYVKTVNPERYDILITVDTEGVFTKEGYQLGGRSYLAAGKTVTFHNGKTVLTSLVTSVSQESD